MANLVTSDLFILDRNLPGQIVGGSLQTIDIYIEKYEKEALVMLLGYTLYKELKAEIEAGVYTAKWSALIDGVEFTQSGYIGEFEGLADMAAYYIFYCYIRDNVVSYEAIGAVTSDGENSVRVSPDSLMVNAWNNFKQKYDVACQYILLNSSTYPKWQPRIPKYTNTFGL